MLLNVSRFMCGDSFISVMHRMSIFILLCKLFFFCFMFYVSSIVMYILK